MVGERSGSGEAGVETFPWSGRKRGCRNEYAITGVRIPRSESLRVPGAGSSALGQSDPKPRPKGVGDGKRANIPAPEDVRYHPQGGRRSESRAGRRSSRCKEVGGPGG